MLFAGTRALNSSSGGAGRGLRQGSDPDKSFSFIIPVCFSTAASAMNPR